jgi:hypothetical protein
MSSRDLLNCNDEDSAVLLLVPGSMEGFWDGGGEIPVLGTSLCAH